jgi:hypothetical protein
MSRARTPATNPAIKAIADVIENLPPEVYPKGHARFLHRLVHIVLAKHANPDGTSIYPSQLTLARECAGMSEYRLRQVLSSLEKQLLIRKLPDKHPVFGTNQYVLLFPSPEEIEAAVQSANSVTSQKKETARKRVARWRKRQKEESVTQHSGVTVTQQNRVTEDGCNATLEGDVTQQKESVTQHFLSVTQQNRVSNGENRRISTTTVLPSSLDRPPQPSIQPSAKMGWLVGWTEHLLSKEVGHVLTAKAKQKELILALAEKHGQLTYAIGVYKLTKCRPYGLSGLHSLSGPWTIFSSEMEKYSTFEPRFDWQDDVTETLEEHKDRLAEIVGTEQDLRQFAELLLAATPPADDPNFAAVEEFIRLSKADSPTSEMTGRRAIEAVQ